MGTWIEIQPVLPHLYIKCVVPCNGNVDWNRSSLSSKSYVLPVVPCNGNVDWNIFSRFRPCGGIQSFPAMGTWIEILRTVNTWTNQHRRSLQWERGLKYVQVINYLVSTRVVPCNGNVDWNLSFYSFSMTFSVVPCNGNVDWNVKGISVPTYTHGRSLQWERGLKLFKW